jgi:hypothetical protein
VFLSKKFDTSWFDLKNYDQLNELDLIGWLEQIEFRREALKVTEIRNRLLQDDDDKEFRDHINLQIQSNIQRIKNNPLARDWPVSKLWPHFKDYPQINEFQFDTVSVYGITAIRHWDIAHDEEIDDVWALVRADSTESDYLTDAEKKLIHRPIDMIWKERGIKKWEDSLKYVTVDFSASDEQIIKDFKDWLVGYRKVTAKEVIKKSFTQSDFDSRIKFGVIAYLDLVIMAKLESKKITAPKLAHLIFPDEYDVGIEGRIRDTTKTKADFLLSIEVIEAMKLQCC